MMVCPLCRDGCAVGREMIVTGALLATWDELSWNHAEVGTDVTTNLRLLTLSVMNMRPVDVEQARDAINACRCRFPAGCGSMVVCTSALLRRIAGGTSNCRDPPGCVLGGNCRSPLVCFWNENRVGCVRCLGLPLVGTARQFSGVD